MTMDFTENENVEWFLKRQIFTLPETLLHFDLGFIISFYLIWALQFENNFFTYYMILAG